MAKITTGDIDLLRVLFDQVDERFSPVGAFRTLLDAMLGSDTASSEQSATEVILYQTDGGVGRMSGDFSSPSMQSYTINRIDYTSPAGASLTLTGRASLKANGGFNTGTFTAFSVSDANGALDPTRQQLNATVNGTVTVTANGDNVSSRVLIKTMTKTFANGYTLLQEATTGLKDYDDTTVNVESRVQVVDSRSGKALLTLENMRDSQDLNLATADDFIAFHLGGNDSIVGTAGLDHLYAGGGNDVVSAGDGADTIVGGDGAGNDSYDGGKGIDTVKYASALAAITVNLAKGTAGSSAGGDLAGIGSDKLKGIENVVAGDFADLLVGSKDANVILGGAGDDTIDGGLGQDTLTGGSGADRFLFSAKPATGNADTVTDFAAGVDRIQLGSASFAKLKGKTELSPHFFRQDGGASQDADDFLVYDRTGGKLYYDADGNGKKAPVLVATVGAGTDLTASDVFIL